VPVVLAPDNESAAMTHHLSDVGSSLVKQCLDIDMVKCPKQASSSMATVLENYLCLCTD